MKRNFKLEDVPIDVQKVWLLMNSGQPFGMKMHEEIDAIKKQYPEWFECNCDNKTNGSEQKTCDGDCTYH